MNDQVFSLDGGNILISTESPGGLYNAAQLRSLAELTEEEGVVIKATEDQRLAIVTTLEKIEELKNKLEKIGLEVRGYQGGLHQPVTCIGEGCPSQQQDALGDSLSITMKLAHIHLIQPFKIGLNGCERSCVPSHTLDISLMGEQAGYRLSIGGKSQHIPELATFIAEGIPREELPELLIKLLEVYKTHSTGGERIHEVIERIGIKPFIEVLHPYSMDAAEGQFTKLEEESSFEVDEKNFPEDVPLEEESVSIEENISEETTPDDESLERDLDLEDESFQNLDSHDGDDSEKEGRGEFDQHQETEEDIVEDNSGKLDKENDRSNVQAIGEETAHKTQGLTETKEKSPSSNLSFGKIKDVRFEKDKIVVGFESGVEIRMPLDAAFYGGGHALKIGEKEVKVFPSSDGVVVELDRFEILIPRNQAA